MPQPKNLLATVITLSIVIVACSAKKQSETATLLPTSITSASSIQTMSTSTTEPTSTNLLNMSQYLGTDEFVLEETLELKKPYYYTIQTWDNPISDRSSDHRISITKSVETILINDAELGNLPQGDITGEGDPDLLIYVGKGSKFGPVYIYNLGQEVTKVFSGVIPRQGGKEGECRFAVQDLNNDGIPEIINCDAMFGFFDCGPSFGPMPQLIYEYNSEIRQYHVVNPLYPNLYTRSINYYTELVKKFPNDKCWISSLLMNYFYSGQIDKGWSQLPRLYQGKDIDEFQKELDEMLAFKQKAGLFVLPSDVKTK